MTPLDFILYAIGFITVGFFLGMAAGSAYMVFRINSSVRHLEDNDLGREETLCQS